MAVTFKSITGQVSGLALALAALALPATAQAQQAEPEVSFRDNEAAGNIGGGNEARRAPRSAPAERTWERPARAAPAAAPAGDYQQGRAAQAPGWDRSASRRDEAGRNGDRRGWENRGNGTGRGTWARPAPSAPPQTTPAPARAAEARDWRGGDRSQAWRRDGDRTSRERTYRDPSYRDRSYREGRDYGWQGDRRRAGNDGHWTNRDDRYRTGQAYRQDYRRWDNRWRDNSRYNWSSYRRAYPSTFRLGAYYSPYRNYSYRRLSIGLFLDSLFFSNRYWINDPWRYRLPDVYGPYRWVRYYDDALLVNTYTGEVADVIYSFFW